MIYVVAFAFWLLTAVGLLIKLYPEGKKRNLRTYCVMWSFGWPVAIPLTLIWQAIQPWLETRFGRFINSRADWLWEIR